MAVRWRRCGTQTARSAAGIREAQPNRSNEARAARDRVGYRPRCGYARPPTARTASGHGTPGAARGGRRCSPAMSSSPRPRPTWVRLSDRVQAGIEPGSTDCGHANQRQEPCVGFGHGRPDLISRPNRTTPSPDAHWTTAAVGRRNGFVKNRARARSSGRLVKTTSSAVSTAGIPTFENPRNATAECPVAPCWHATSRPPRRVTDAESDPEFGGHHAPGSLRQPDAGSCPSPQSEERPLPRRGVRLVTPSSGRSL